MRDRYRGSVDRDRRHTRSDDFDALLDVAQTRNEFVFEAPLPDAEVVATARSAWRYEQEGRNWVGTTPRTILAREELLYFARHKRGGDALILWAYLDGQHAKSGTTFAVDREAMAAANILPAWTAWRYRQAIAALRELKLLSVEHGGHRRSDLRLAPYQYRLSRPLAGFRQDATGTGVVRTDAFDQGGAG